MSRIIVTGANSPVGMRVLARLRRQPGVELEAWVSGRPGSSPPPDGCRTCRAVDLRQPLPSDAEEAISQCDALLHLAWFRSPDPARAIAENTAMIRGLARRLRQPGALRIVSSVSSGPNAHSAYGKAKYAANQLVLETGAAALLLGLIVEREPEAGPYRMLRNVVRKLPFRIRFADRNPNVYPVREHDAMELLAAFALTENLRGLYRGFPPPLGINRFLKLLEEAHPRFRLPLPLFARPLLATARIAGKLHLPGAPLLDKVATLLHKDDEYLQAQQELPGWTPECCDQPGFFS